MPSDSSVSVWIAGLKASEADAAQKVWDHFAYRLVEMARRKLGTAPKGIADEEDIAQSVFRSVCRGAAAGRLQNVTNRDELWWMLLAITRQKVVDHVRREMSLKRGAGRVQREATHNGHAHQSGRFMLDQLVGEEPTPEFVVMLEEEHDRLLAMLRDDHLRQIATARIEGFTVAEIADQLQVSTRSIERKLQLIRGVWLKGLDP
jgi:DNA-directed RNA polymerase specialized sigma24 family protein